MGRPRSITHALSSRPFKLPIMQFSLITVYGLLAAAIAAPTANTKRHVVHERRDRLPSQWKRNAKVHVESTLPMRIALTQSNLDRADEFLMDVSHPESPNYGKHVRSNLILSQIVRILKFRDTHSQIHSERRFICFHWFTSADFNFSSGLRSK